MWLLSSLNHLGAPTYEEDVYVHSHNSVTRTLCLAIRCPRSIDDRVVWHRVGRPIGKTEPCGTDICTCRLVYCLLLLSQIKVKNDEGMSIKKNRPTGSCSLRLSPLVLFSYSLLLVVLWEFWDFVCVVFVIATQPDLTKPNPKAKRPYFCYSKGLSSFVLRFFLVKLKVFKGT